MSRKFLHILLAAMAVPVVLSAQVPEVSYPNNLVMDSVDPKGDSLYLRQIRKKMADVRRKQKRPAIALVLCGGGAKGASEIGAIKYLEELDIPIDMVCGTSIGGLLGGLYATGYDAESLDSLMMAQDWKKILSDKTDPKVVPLYKKIYYDKYLITIPFHYGKDPTKKAHVDDATYTVNGKRLTLTQRKKQDKMDARSITSSLPSGYVYGLNVGNLLSSLTVGYHDSMSFADLPIPYSCVASDLVSTKEKNWGSGSLKMAMRSTMSIPGLFSPVRERGMVLVDGGTRNNFPTDVARAAGADIIIGIDLTDTYLSYSQVNNFGDMLKQFISMLSRGSYDQTSQIADIYIHPDLTGYDMMSFNKEAIDTMIARGYRAALAKKDQLMELKKAIANAGRTPVKARTVNIQHHPVKIASISFEGLPEKDAKILENKIALDVDKPVDAGIIEQAMFKIQATEAVEHVSYSLLGEKEPYDLVFSCAPSPTHQGGIGLRFDSQMWIELLLNFGLNTRKLAGSKMDVTAKLGLSQSLSVKYLYDTPGMPTVNVDASVTNQKAIYYTMDGLLPAERMNLYYLRHSERVFISANKWTRLEGQLGISHTGYRPDMNRTGVTAYLAFQGDEKYSSFLGAFFNMTYRTLDRTYYPNRGIEIKCNLDSDFYKTGASSCRPVSSAYFNIKGAVKMCDWATFIPDFHLRHVFDDGQCTSYSATVTTYGVSKEDYESGKATAGDITAIETEYHSDFSFFHRNFLGGDYYGKYFTNQIPFHGYTGVTDCAYDKVTETVTALSATNCKVTTATENRSYNNVAIINLDFRFRLIEDLYLSVKGGYAYMGGTYRQFITFDRENTRNMYGTSLELGYNSLFGPLKIAFNWANRDVSSDNIKERNSHNFGIYLSAGFNF